MALPMLKRDEGARQHGPGQRRPLACLTRGQLLALVACAACFLAFGGIKLPGEAAGAAARDSEADSEAAERLLGAGVTNSNSTNSTSSEHHSSHAAHHKSGAVNPSIFFLVTFFASALAQFITSILPHEIRLPHSVLLYFIGTFMAYLAMSHGVTADYQEAITAFANLDPHVIFWVFLPALLFEDAAGAEWPVIQRVLPSALLLALPGVIVNTLLTGVFVRYCMHDWDWWMSFLLGSILSATDPVAVVGALSALSAPAKLSHLISGESLFNDGSAVALFQIFLAVAGGKKHFEIGSALGTMAQLALGGPAFGLVAAAVASLWLKWTKKLNIQVIIILCGVYGCFFVGEYNLKVSGVLAVVVFGLYMSAVGRYSLNIGVEHQYHAIINFLALISHESIFTIAGVIGYKFMSDSSTITWRDYLDLLTLYVAIHVTRTLAVLMLWPLLSRMGYGLSRKEAIICIYGGLRGAVGLAMASVAGSDWELGSSNPYAKRIGFHTAGIVVLTLIINGTTITPLYKWLRVDPSKGGRHHQKLLKSGLEEADKEVQKVIEGLKTNWFYHNCDFETIQALVPKLTDMVLHEKLNFYGKIQLLCHEKAHVDSILLELASKMAKKLEDDPNCFRSHCNEKIDMHKARSEDEENPSPLSPKKRGFAQLSKGASELEGSEEMMSEVYQSVLNAITAEYDEAYEQQTLPTAAYRVLSMAAQYQESAIDGELGVPKYGLPHPKFLDGDKGEIVNLKDKSRIEQMKSCFTIGWIFLEDSLSKPRQWWHQQLVKVLGHQTISLDWVLLTRNAFIILQYVSTCEHILSDTKMFDDFKDMLHGPLKKVKEQAISKGMEQLMSRDHGMFILLEHCLCARHVFREMRRIVADQYKEGTLSLEDQKRIFSEVVRPSEQVMEEFLPRKEHLELLSSQGAMKSKSWLDRLLFDVVLERAETMH